MITPNYIQGQGMPQVIQGHRMVVFVDLLGFSNLVMNFDAGADEPGDLGFHGSSLEDLDRYVSYQGNDQLRRQFATFHGIIDFHVRRFTSYDEPHSVAFSDSAFIAFHFPVYAYQFAVDVMRDLLIRQTPARIGIALGTFRGRRFSADTTRSVQRHSFQFFGTGVVGAYNAEKCGVKGMRILLHPEITPLPMNAVVAVADPTDPTRPLRPQVAYELNYIAKGLRLASTFDGEEREEKFDGDHLAVKVSMMKRDSPPIDDVQIQYQRTLDAIQKMRGVGQTG